MTDDLIKEWYCEIESTVYGPMSLQDLRRMVDGGKLTPNDMVRRGEAAAWMRAANLDGLFDRRDEPAPPPITVPGVSTGSIAQNPHAGIAGDTPPSDWGQAGLIVSATFLLVTPGVLVYSYFTQGHGGRVTSLLLFLLIDAIIFLGQAAGFALALTGLISGVRRKFRVAFGLGGTIMAALGLLLWLLITIAALRMLD